MDLNKDNKNIYTIDSSSYARYMNKNQKEPTDFLSSLITLLLIILLLILSYFFYKIIKEDLSFSEVFNKKEFYATFTQEESLKVEAEVPVVKEVTEEKIVVIEKPKEIVVEKKVETPKIVVMSKPKEVAIEKVEEILIVKEKPMIIEEEPRETKVNESKIVVVMKPEEIKKETARVESPKLIKTNTEKLTDDEDVLSAEYLNRISAEMNSF